jgi:predicted RNase H-like HicB family nuclease
MTTLSSPNAASHQTTHAFDVLIKLEPEGKFSATVLGLPEYRATGSDRTSALAALRQLLTEDLSQAEIVSINIAVPQLENPWLKIAGRYKDDPHFDEMLADIEVYRRERDVEMELSFHKPDEQVQPE